MDIIITIIIIIILTMLPSLSTLVPEGPWCVFYATRNHVYWRLTHNVFFFCWYSKFDITHKDT